jgi:hypothetical protein
MTNELIFPAFVFARRSDIEREAGLLLVGQLVLDIPSDTKEVTRRELQNFVEIAQQLAEGVRLGEMPDDAVVYGWHGGGRPANAVDVEDHVLMESWARGRIHIELRIPRDDSTIH